jgi:hypothetical protein
MSGVDATTSHGVGRSRSFVARSIAYDSRTLGGGPEVLFPLYFKPSQTRIFSAAYFFSRVPGKRREKPKKKTEKPKKTEKKREKPEKTEKKRKNRKPGKTGKTGKSMISKHQSMYM